MEDLIDKESSIPYYSQLKKLITEKIINKEFPKDKIWSEHEISRKFGVSVSTVRRALYEMRRESILRTVKGVGNFVCKPKIDFDLSKFLSIGKELKRKGITEEIIVLNEKVIKSEDSLFYTYTVRNLSDKVIYIERVRKIGGEPIAYEKIFLNNDLCSPIIKEKGNILIYDYIVDNLGINIKSIEEYIEPKNLDLLESKFLNRKKGSVAFLVVRISYDVEDKYIEFRKTIISGDKCKYYIKIK